jgi:TctA family transporter
MIGHLKPETKLSCHAITLTSRKRKKVQALYALSRRNLWELLLFLLLSIGVFSFREFDLFAVASAPVRQLLGCPPPALLINFALATYLFSAVTILLTRMANASRPEQKWSQLGYRTVFYLFYSFSGTLSGHFVAVFTIGILLYGLDQLNVWQYTEKVLRREKLLLSEP